MCPSYTGPSTKAACTASRSPQSCGIVAAMAEPTLVTSASPPLPHWLLSARAIGELRQLARHHRTLLTVCCLAPVVMLGWTLGSARSPAQYPIDLIPTYVAGRLWLENHTEAVYHGGAWMPAGGFDPAWLEVVQTQHVPLPDTAFVYSPIYLALLLPLIAITTAQQFFWCFAVGNAASAVLVGVRCASLAGVSRGWRSVVVIVAIASSFPASYAGLLGQNVLPAAALMLFGFDAIERGQRRGVVWLVLASAFKPWAIASLGVLLLGRKFRPFVVALLAHAVVFGLVPRLFWPELLSGYQDVLRNLSTINVLAFNSVGLRALAHRLASPDWIAHATEWAKHTHAGNAQLVGEALLLTASVAALCWIAWRRRPCFSCLYTSYMSLLLSVLGVCWSHYLVFALPVICIGLFRAAGPASRWLAAIAAFWLLTCMSGAVPPVGWLIPPRAWALAYSAPLLLSVWLAWLQLWGPTNLPARRALAQPSASATP